MSKNTQGHSAFSVNRQNKWSLQKCEQALFQWKIQWNHQHFVTHSAWDELSGLLPTLPAAVQQKRDPLQSTLSVFQLFISWFTLWKMWETFYWLWTSLTTILKLLWDLANRRREKKKENLKKVSEKTNLGAENNTRD